MARNWDDPHGDYPAADEQQRFWKGFITALIIEFAALLLLYNLL